MAVAVRSDFLGYNNFPEVYHGGEISKALRLAAWRGARSGPETLHIDKIAADGVAYLVSGGRGAAGGERQIRDSGFSDPGRNEKRKEQVYYPQHHFQK